MSLTWIALIPWSAATVACPAGWTASVSGKCMRLAGTASHEGCAAICGAGNSLACIESASDDVLAAQLSPKSVADFVWVGEYQYPFEPDLRFGLRCPAGSCLANLFFGVPYNGQPGWGMCSNGKSTNGTIPPRIAVMQPNNFNGGEDCMARSPGGYGDNVCNSELPCLCEYGTATSVAYTATHGPELTARARASTDMLWSTFSTTITTAAILGSLPSIIYCLFVELYFVRRRQRAAPSNAAEATLQQTIRMALRRQMLQSGTALFIGGVLIGVSLPAQPMFADGSWPCFGWDFQVGAPIVWAMLKYPGVLIFLLSVRPSQTLTVRVMALGWSIFVLVNWLYLHFHPPTWLWGPRAPEQVAIIYTFRGLGLAASCASGVWWKRNALPSRIALRWLWYCIRLETILVGVEFLIDSLPYMSSPVKDVAGTPMVVSSVVIIVFGLAAGTPVRRFVQALLGGFGASAKDASSAVVVQSMVPGDAVEAIRDAHSRLYCIAISALTEADMANNQDSGLFKKTKKSVAGECDAFLSHSWRDDAKLKWARMLEFKAEFEAANAGSEPTCWLDKACIDQAGDINAALRALPIFLLASKHFVVFVGESYFKRMWCVLEAFTFVRAGGKLEQVVLKPLKGENADTAIAELDVRKASCYLRADYHRILAIIESSYGSSAQFNDACKQLLASKLGTSAKKRKASQNVTTATRGHGARGKYQVAVAPMPSNAEPKE